MTNEEFETRFKEGREMELCFEWVLFCIFHGYTFDYSDFPRVQLKNIEFMQFAPSYKSWYLREKGLSPYAKVGSDICEWMKNKVKKQMNII
ncbi:MAG: hypothetical protein HPY53_12500 [Brevinematales bacterium]|nr:hypothetical protein [Brevinematales bacterium]